MGGDAMMSLPPRVNHDGNNDRSTQLHNHRLILTLERGVDIILKSEDSKSLLPIRCSFTARHTWWLTVGTSTQTL